MLQAAGAAVPEAGRARVRVLDGLAAADDEHPDVSLSHESGRSLGAFRGGLLIRENAEGDPVAPGRCAGSTTRRPFGSSAFRRRVTSRRSRRFPVGGDRYEPEATGEDRCGPEVTGESRVPPGKSRNARSPGASATSANGR
jgi:hypothetical protein